MLAFADLGGSNLPEETNNGPRELDGSEMLSKDQQKICSDGRTATFALVGSRLFSFEPSTAGAEEKIRMLDVSAVREKKTGKKIPAGEAC
jgi:hypothetical protein